LCTLTPEVQCRLVHRNHVIWRTKITRFWRNGNDSKQPWCNMFPPFSQCIFRTVLMVWYFVLRSRITTFWPKLMWWRLIVTIFTEPIKLDSDWLNYLCKLVMRNKDLCKAYIIWGVRISVLCSFYITQKKIEPRTIMYMPKKH
jgi:hypothetical protein